MKVHRVMVFYKVILFLDRIYTELFTAHDTEIVSKRFGYEKFFSFGAYVGDYYTHTVKLFSQYARVQEY